MIDRRVLIFGISGFVGPYLADEFHRNGYEVYGSDIRKSSSPASMTEYYDCDLLDINSVKQTIYLVQPTDIVNLAAISSVGLSWKMPCKTVEINVCGAINILEAARGCSQLPNILLIGSSEEYVEKQGPINEKDGLNAGNPYGISKMMQEEFASLYRKHYGMRIFYVRSFNHTGIGQADTFVIPSWCKQAAKITASGMPGIIHVGNLDVIRDFSNVKDVVRAYRMVMEKGDCNEVYNIGNGQPKTLKEILEYVISLSDQPIRIDSDQSFFRPYENPELCCDNALIEDRVGWKPQYTVYDTITDLYQYYLSQIQNG